MFSFIAGEEISQNPQNDGDRQTHDNQEEDVVNPYPLVIVPKFGSPTPLKSRGKLASLNVRRRSGN